MFNVFKGLDEGSMHSRDNSYAKRRFPIYQLQTQNTNIHKSANSSTKKISRREKPSEIPKVNPAVRCGLRQLRLENVVDWLTIIRDYLTTKLAEESTQNLLKQINYEVDEIQAAPLMIGTLKEIIDNDFAIVSNNLGSDTYVPILSVVDRSKLQLDCTVLMHQKTCAIVGVLENKVSSLLSIMKVEKAPLESYEDVGGLTEQIQEIKETVELPLLHPELYTDIGIIPPKGVILYGPPGTGKTLLAKAVARETAATFLKIVGSELIQSYTGEGPKLVREMFRAARENAPSIIFIDEIDAIGTKRYKTERGEEREIQRTMLELLNQLDGFNDIADVKIIMATNRIQSLDPALIRPGRIDKKIELPVPDIKAKRKVFDIHTKKMTLAPDVDFTEFVSDKSELSGADIRAICTEAGLLALREMRMKVTQEDFRKAKEKTLHRIKGKVPQSLYV